VSTKLSRQGLRVFSAFPRGFCSAWLAKERAREQEKENKKKKKGQREMDPPLQLSLAHLASHPRGPSGLALEFAIPGAVFLGYRGILL
jgi:hypothetical protein